MEQSIFVKSKIVTCVDDVASDWIQLYKVSDATFFLSWHWIGPWLEHIIKENPPTLISVYSQKEIIGIVLIHCAVIRRRLFFKRNLLFFNELPLAQNNMVIEYNGLLVKKGYESIAWKNVLQYLQEEHFWDEIHLNAVDNMVTESVISAASLLPIKLAVVDQQQISIASFNSDISKICEIEKNILSKNKRLQIRRTSKLYASKYGIEPECVEAATVKEALDFFDELGTLHTSYWESKGKTGSFFNPSWVVFHRNVIKQGFNDNAIQLLCIKSGNEVVGYLYNLVGEKVVYNVQSGIKYLQDNRYKTGYLCHFLAIVHNSRKGLNNYNFLAGESPYKKSLSNEAEELNWLILRSTNKRQFILEDALVSLVRFCRKAIKR